MGKPPTITELALSVMRTTFLVFLACLLFLGCSPRQTPSTPAKNSVPQGETFTFLGGTTMHVRERTGDSLKGIHIVKKSPAGSLENIHAENGRVSEGPDMRTMRVVIYDAHVDSGPTGQYAVGELTMDFMKDLDTDSLRKIARDLRYQRLTN